MRARAKLHALEAKVREWVEATRELETQRRCHGRLSHPDRLAACERADRADIALARAVHLA